MIKLLTRFKGWVASLTGALAVVVVVMANIDKFANTLAGWLHPWLVTNATIEVVIDPSVSAPVIVAIVEGSKALQTEVIKFGDAYTFEPPVNGRYIIMWQGAGIKAASVPDILAPKQKLRYRLSLKEKAESEVVLALRLEGEAQDKPTNEPTATALASVAAAQTVRDPASRPPSSNLFPEFDRAALVIGLLETGTTNCHGSVFVKEHVINIGCFALTFSGGVGAILREVKSELPQEFAAVFDADSLAYVASRIGGGDEPGPASDPSFLSGAQRRDRLAAALSKIVRWPAFRHHYEAKLLSIYGDAMRIAARVGLRSERGVLLIFDSINALGAGRARQTAERYIAQGLPEAALPEPTKVAGYADFLRRDLPDQIKRMIEPRLRLMVSGKARSGGISFDLNELGIRDDVSMLAAD